jgi:hypothetical protein
MDSTMVVCVRCGGRQFLAGVAPRRQTRDEMSKDFREKGKLHAICKLCDRVSCLKREALDRPRG